MDAFKVIKNSRAYDYREGKPIDIVEVRAEFGKEFEILDVEQKERHVIAIVRRDGIEYILKIATTEGISIRSESEKVWNDEFNRYSNNPHFRVPENFEDGEFHELYFLVMEKFDGPPVCKLDGSDNSIEINLDQIISFSEHIQTLPLNIPINDAVQSLDHREWFVKKTKTWLDSIPKDAVEQYEIGKLFEQVQEGAPELKPCPRHGDFTPWHLIVLNNGLGLIDGEHAHSHGVENYDICYFIQRVHSVLQLPNLSEKILGKLLRRGYDKGKLKTVLASRAIGGFLDESLKESPDFKDESEFKDRILKL